MTLDIERQNFLDAELFQLTLSAVTQRGGVYRTNLSEAERRPVHRTLRKLLRDLSSQYANGSVSDDQHNANIRNIAETVSQLHSPLLRDDAFRIGSAQKALNLHLKYLWCLEVIPMPPHCPFDAYVLREIPGWRTRRWTAIAAIDQYADLVAAARQVAGGTPLAEWELSVYNRNSIASSAPCSITRS